MSDVLGFRVRLESNSPCVAWSFFDMMESMRNPQNLDKCARIFLFLIFIVPHLNGQKSFAQTIDFGTEIAPILHSKCYSCHNGKKSKGGYRIDKLGLINEPGESNLWPMIKGEPEESNLWRLIDHNDESMRMPLDADPLPLEEKRLIKAWILEGPDFGDHFPQTDLGSILPRPNYPDPPKIYRSPYPTNAIAFAPDENWLATGGIHEILIFDISDGKASLILRIPSLPERIHKILWLDSFELLVAGGNPGRIGEIVRTKIEKDRSTSIIPLAKGEDSFFDIIYLDSSDKIATIGADGRISIINLNTSVAEKVLVAHSDWGFDLSLVSIDGDSYLFSCGRDKSVRSYNLETSKLNLNLTGFKAPLRNLVIHPGSKFGICLIPQDESLMTWNIDKERIGKKINLPGVSVTSILKLGENLLIGDSVGSLHRFDKEWSKILFSKKLGESRVTSIHSTKDHRNLGVTFASGKIAMVDSDEFQPIFDFPNLPED